VAGRVPQRGTKPREDLVGEERRRRGGSVVARARRAPMAAARLGFERGAAAAARRGSRGGAINRASAAALACGSRKGRAGRGAAEPELCPSPGRAQGGGKAPTGRAHLSVAGKKKERGRADWVERGKGASRLGVFGPSGGKKKKKRDGEWAGPEERKGRQEKGIAFEF